MTTTPPAPTVTVFTDAAPCPRAEVVITPMPGDVDTITVYRTWRGQRSVVRGASRTGVAGALLVVDYEVPLGTAVSYSSVGYSTVGAPSEESTSTVVSVSVNDVWIQDPLDPASAIQVGLTIPRETQVVFPAFLPGKKVTPSTIVAIAGSGLPVGLGGARQALSGIPFTLHTTTQSATDILESLLEQAYPLCVRVPAAVPQMNGLVYLAIGETTPDPGNDWVETTFAMTADVVRGPGAAIVIQPRTYAALPDEAATYTALKTLYPTYLDVRRGL